MAQPAKTDSISYLRQELKREDPSLLCLAINRGNMCLAVRTEGKVDTLLNCLPLHDAQHFHSLWMISHMNLSYLLRFSLLYLLFSWTWEVSGWSQAPSISIPALSIAVAGWAQSLSADPLGLDTTQALTRMSHCLNTSTACDDHLRFSPLPSRQPPLRLSLKT